MLKCFFIKHSHSSEYRKQLGVCIFHIQNREARDRTPSLLTAKITYSTSGPTATPKLMVLVETQSFTAVHLLIDKLEVTHHSH